MNRTAAAARAPSRRQRWLIALTGPLLVLAGCGVPGDATPSSTAAVPEVVADHQIELVLGLQRSQEELSSFAELVNTPSDSSFGSFLTLEQVGARFGASPETISTARDFLTSRGVDQMFTDPAGGYLRVELQVAEAQDLFGGDWSVVDRDGIALSRPQGTPQIPAELLGVVTEIVGDVQVVHRPAQQDASIEGQVSDSVGCRESRQRRAAIRQRYGVAELQRDGNRGKGMSIAIPTIQHAGTVALHKWSSCFGAALPKIRMAEVGGQVSLDRNDEITLDVTAVHSILPELHEVRVVQFDEFDWVGDAFALALTAQPKLPDAIVSSVVYCAASLQPAAIQLSEYVLATAAAAGVTVVAATGDTGSSGCYPAEQAAASTYPAASQFVTAVGGSTFTPGTPNSATTPDHVWRDGTDLAGGGAPALEFDAPSYQEPGRRTIPDLAIVADPELTPPIPQCSGTGACAWGNFGGTSYGAPVVAAAFLSIKQRLRSRGGTPPGNFNPSLYRLMQPGEVSRAPVIDIISGDNDLFSVGCCTAAVGYDLASGWGAPDFDALAQTLESFDPKRQDTPNGET